MLVFLEYGIMFNPSEVWQHVGQFEASFGKFLSEHGLEANIISGADDSPGKRVLFVSKKEELAPPTEEPEMKSKKRLKAFSKPRVGGKFDVQRK